MSKYRPIILLAILAILGVALCYDMLVARPALTNGYETVMKMLEGASFRVEDSVKPADVQKALGKTPTSTRQQGLTTVETYEYRAGFPLRTYKLYVLYQGLKNPMLHKVLANEEPTASDIMKVEVVTPDNAEEMKGEPVAATAGAGPGAGGGGAGGGGRRKKGPAVPPAGDPADENNPENSAEKTPEKNDGSSAPNPPTPSEPKPAEPKPEAPKSDAPTPPESKPAEPNADPAKPDATSPAAAATNEPKS